MSRASSSASFGASVVALEEVADAPHVVVAQEGGQRIDVGVFVGEVVVLGEHLCQVRSAAALGSVAARLRLEPEVQHCLHVGPGGVVGEQLLVGTVDLAKGEEVGLPCARCTRQNGRRELLPELGIDVFHRVDAEAVDVEVLHPVLVDIGHAGDHIRMLGEEVVQPEEVTVQ